MGAGSHSHGKGHHQQGHPLSGQHTHGHDHGGGGGGEAPTRKEILRNLLKDLRAQLKVAIANNNKERQKTLRARISAVKQELESLGETVEQDPLDEEPLPGEDEGELGGGGGVIEPPPEPPPVPAPPVDPHKDVREMFRQFLVEWGLPETLMAFINDSLAQGLSQTEITQRLYLTQEYLSVFPEGEARRQAGLSWWAPAQIRQYREEAKRIARQWLGIENITNQEISGLITGDISLPEWESRLQTWRQFERWGPTVRAVLEQELGYRIPDDRVFAFLSPELSTPELDRAYEKALLRGQPALLGLGVRPEEEAEILRRFGISPEQAFRGYQNLAQELPAQERFALIEAEIGRNLDRFPTGTELFADTPFALLFRGIQLGEVDALRELQARLARETARWQAGGGVAQQGGALTGLAPREER
jgi:hypothetical protein